MKNVLLVMIAVLCIFAWMSIQTMPNPREMMCPMGKHSTDFRSLGEGDLLYFTGKGMASGVIRAFTSSDFSHVGIVVEVMHGRIMFIHSDPDMGGVQVEDLHVKLKESRPYDMCFVQRMKASFRKQSMLKKGWKQRWVGKKFDKQVCRWFVGLGKKSTMDDTLFCSEFVEKFMASEMGISMSNDPSTSTPVGILDTSCLMGQTYHPNVNLVYNPYIQRENQCSIRAVDALFHGRLLRSSFH